MNPYNILRSSIPQNKTSIYYNFFRDSTVKFISESITKRLENFHRDNKNIIVSDRNIKSVMDSMYENNNKDIDMLVMMTISYIVDYVKADLQQEWTNEKLSAWVTNFGEETGLRQYSSIKLNERRANFFEFNMNY